MKVKVKEGEKKEEYLDFSRELKKVVKRKRDTNHSRCLWTGLQELGEKE